MTKQKSVKGLLIYLLIGIIAIFPVYLLGLSTNPAELEILLDNIKKPLSGSHFSCL